MQAPRTPGPPRRLHVLACVPLQGTQKAGDDIAHDRRIAAAYSEYLESVRGGQTAIGRGGSIDRTQGLGDLHLRGEARDYEDEYTWTSHDRIGISWLGRVMCMDFCGERF